jgi:hypothetical protein
VQSQDDNIVQAMEQAQADKLDHWNPYTLALVPTTAGVLMGLAGLLGWHIHPDMIARLLS